MSVYVMYEWFKDRICYKDLKSARKAIYDWAKENKETECYVFDSDDSPIPIGSAIQFATDENPTWFDIINADICIPDSGSSEDVGVILSDGSIREY